jgi:outer membrane receptor protein involved in Fe transport
LLGFTGTIWWPICCYQRPAANIDQSMNDDDTVIRANVSYSVTDDVMLFATYAEGYRPGGINRSFSGPLPPAYTADFVKSYEVGAKTTLLGGRMRLNGAIYFQNWDDFQLSRLDLSIAPITLTANVGTAESNGFEADFAFLASDRWEFSGALSYNDAELTKDYWVVQANEGITPPDVPKGTALPRVPDFKFNLGTRYNAEILGRRSYIQATYVYTGSSWSQFSDTFKETRQEQDPYEIVNLAWGIAEDVWEAELFVRNAFDERGEVYVSNNSWDSRVTTNRPRTLGLRFRQRFN